MTIGERLKIVRGSLSQSEAARRIGMKQQSWRIYETDGSAPGARLVKRICETFGVTSDWLLGVRDGGGIVANNSAVVVGGGTAINERARTRAYACGEEIECKRCPYKKKVEQMRRLALK